MSEQVVHDAVDSHVHLLPPRLARKVRAAFDAHGGAPLAYDTDPYALLADLERVGVTAAWALPYAHKPGVSEWLVPATAAHLDELRAAHATPGRGIELVLGATVHPGDDDPVAVLHSAVEEHGARVLKLHCSVGGYQLDDPALAGVWEACAAWRLPVIAHVGKHVGGTSGDHDLLEVEAVAERHPELPLIVAHAAHPAVGATLRTMERYPNVHADLTPVVTEVPELGTEALLHHARRLLFGSDAPNTGHRVGSLLARIAGAPVPAAVRDAICGGNARRLLGGVRTG